MFAIDDVITGALVNVLALAGRRLVIAAGDFRNQKYADDLDLARWFDTGRLTGTMPGVPEGTAARLAAILNGDEAQAALQELLAARLTDAAELYTTTARATLTATLAVADPGAAVTLTDFYDDEICALVARLESADLPLLTQIRSDAFANRMIAILHAIERHTAALTTRPDQHAEARFLDSYRRHVIDRHGMLEPPDFQRRRRVPIADIYVLPEIFRDIPAERPVVPPPGTPSATVQDLAEELDRSVLLGDPGGGKTTASNVLMHHFAGLPDGRVPFLVTLRDYAASDPPQRSVTGHIEHTLETLYQCPPPPGLVDLLLLTARAVVIFDGLDELLESSRRADVSARVEQFCVEYPLAPVLVTSRAVGYSQASLDGRHFACYLLGGFEDDQVAQYAQKWFALAPGTQPSDADAFMAESQGVHDLRSNPLLLSLMCILYRGAGSLPQDRDEIFAKCTDLLIRDWDDYRRIRHELRAGRQVKPILRHLAWCLFSSHDGRTEVTERELIGQTAEFLRSSFESVDDAQDAAQEFVRFCHGRMWIFTDVGTTAAGETLYAFTHRTFLEYFAAAYLAYDCDTPGELAEVLARHLVLDEWPVVAELAVQIKDRSSGSGAARVYAALLDDADQRSREDRVGILRFLAVALRSVDPSPQQVRALTRRLITDSVTAECELDPADGGSPTHQWQEAVLELVRNCSQYRDMVADEIGAAITALTSHGDPRIQVNCMRLVASIPAIAQLVHTQTGSFWETFSTDLMRADAAPTMLAAEMDPYVRCKALGWRLITVGQALRMPGGLTALGHRADSYYAGFGTGAFLWTHLQALIGGEISSSTALIRDLAEIGEYLADYSGLPWPSLDPTALLSPSRYMPAGCLPAPADGQLGPFAYLGAAALLAMLAEGGGGLGAELRRSPDFRLLPGFVLYLRRRFQLGRSGEPLPVLPDLPVPEEFRQLFRDWADGKVSLASS